ncbi:MAG: MBL fold metallo-hydrolase [Akkermansiaceae bacterium]
MASSETSITFLGTGTSVGVPVIGCDCPVCRSTDERNIRTRSSLFVSTPKTKILIDSGPDLREQALREKITTVDAVLYTHSHLDHVAGFDELRAFCWSKQDPLPLYATESCLEVLKNMFGWAFHASNTYGGYVKPDAKIISGPFKVDDVEIQPLPVIHGTVETTGFRITTADQYSFAYIPDVKSIPQSTLDLLSGLDLLIIDSLREKPHSTHLSLSEALEISENLNPKQTILTHISHELEHEALKCRLPDGVSPARDGMKLILK